MGVSAYLHVCLLLRIEKETNVTIYGKQDLLEVLVADLIREARNVEQLPNRLLLLYTVMYYHRRCRWKPNNSTDCGSCLRYRLTPLPTFS